MMGDIKSWFGKFGLPGRHHLATQAVVLMPVVAFAGLTAWTMLSAPTNAKSQSAAASARLALGDAAPVQTEAAQPATSEATPAEQAAPAEPPAVGGLKISSQSWRRGGLGSNALITFTLRNTNAYKVDDIAIACSFSRRDGSHLTDRIRVIPDAIVNAKSRKTFARIHIGYVNINANKAKCEPVAANRT